LSKKQKLEVEDFERAIRNAVNNLPGLTNLSEAVYVELYRTALEVIDTGLEMREQELTREGGGS